MVQETIYIFSDPETCLLDETDFYKQWIFKASELQPTIKPKELTY